MNNVLIVYHAGNETEILPELQHILLDKDIKFVSKERDELSDENCCNVDLIIIIGGDGTFLRTSHRNNVTPMLGINPKPKSKEGFYMHADKNDFMKKIPKIFDNMKTKELLRLMVSINDNILPEKALNDIYIGDDTPYNMFNYELSIKGKDEFQRSSGVLIGTPSGSHAWLKSAGGKEVNMFSDKYQFVVREPYEGRLTGKFRHKSGFLKRDDMLEIKAKSDGIVVIDSNSKEYPIKAGDVVSITVADSLKYVDI